MENEKLDHEISRRLSRTLDYLGYSQEMVEFRRQAYVLDSFITSHTYPYLRVRIVGSKGEGTTKFVESDTDILAIIRVVTCSENSFQYEITPNEYHQMTYFKTIQLTPGYCFLKLTGIQGGVDLLMVFGLYKVNSSLLLSTRYFEQFYNFVQLKHKQNSSVQQKITGPALSEHILNFFDMDCVFSIPCSSPSILLQWGSRPRRNDWPPVEVRQKIVQMSGNVVPCGFDQETHLIWRFCFNEIELVISQCWNDTQTKLYKLLKCIKSDCFKLKGFEVSSYMMKNIVFWLAETYPKSLFRPETLFTWVVKALRLFKRSVAKNFLPYYMIPGRNLLKEKIKNNRLRKHLQAEIIRIINSEQLLLFELKKIGPTLYMSSSELADFQYHCDLMEKLFMCAHVRGFCLKENDELWNFFMDESHRLCRKIRPAHLEDKLQRVKGQNLCVHFAWLT